MAKNGPYTHSIAVIVGQEAPVALGVPHGANPFHIHRPTLHQAHLVLGDHSKPATLQPCEFMLLRGEIGDTPAARVQAALATGVEEVRHVARVHYES